MARAREGRPDLILLDYNMPVMDGYHTLIELRTDPGLKSIPVVMVTTETSRETVVKLLKLGLNDYIAKPFTRELLLKKINPILGLYAGDAIPENSVAKAEPGSTSVSSPAVTGVKQSILAVDDKASILQLLRDHIGDQFELTTEESGKAALKTLSQKRFDYVFLDLSLPDMSWTEVVKAYVQKVSEGASEKKIIAMTLRSAHPDIQRASEAGIHVVLYKPFTHADVKAAIEQVIANQKKPPEKKLRYLVANGQTRILECPAEKSSRCRFYAAALTSGIMQEIDMIVEDGLRQLIITVGEGFLTEPLVCQDFVSLIDHVRQTPVVIRLVADSAASREALKQITEISDLPMDVSLECALSSISS